MSEKDFSSLIEFVKTLDVDTLVFLRGYIEVELDEG